MRRRSNGHPPSAPQLGLLMTWLHEDWYTAVVDMAKIMERVLLFGMKLASKPAKHWLAFW